MRNIAFIPPFLKLADKSNSAYNNTLLLNIGLMKMKKIRIFMTALLSLMPFSLWAQLSVTDAVVFASATTDRRVYDLKK